jgi:hypothetical protein
MTSKPLLKAGLQPAITRSKSEFNAAQKDGGKDPLIFDAPLTEKGHRQAKEAKVQIADLGIKQVITSPYNPGDTNLVVHLRQHCTDYSFGQTS